MCDKLSILSCLDSGLIGTAELMEGKLTIADNLAHAILNNGVKIPLLGLGTYELQGESLKKSLKYALDAGYRHIGTAIFRDLIVEILQSFTKMKRKSAK